MSQPTPKAEPVLTAEGIRLVLAGLVALGWFTLDEPTLMAVATAVVAVGSIVASLWARARVSPLVRRWLGEAS